MIEPVQLNEEYYTLLRQLQEIDFVLVELNLYLDTHPDDPQALQQYNATAQQRAEIAYQFETRFGPLRHFGQSFSEYPYRWVDSPWPWQV